MAMKQNKVNRQAEKTILTPTTYLYQHENKVHY